MIWMLDWYLDGSVAVVGGLSGVVTIIMEMLLDCIDGEMFVDRLSG